MGDRKALWEQQKRTECMEEVSGMERAEGLRMLFWLDYNIEFLKQGLGHRKETGSISMWRFTREGMDAFWSHFAMKG